MVDHPAVGVIVGYPAALQGPGKLGQQGAAGPRQNADPGEVQPLFYVDPFHLAGDPLGFSAGLVEHVRFDPAGMRGRSHGPS